LRLPVVPADRSSPCQRKLASSDAAAGIPLERGAIVDDFDAYGV
jgi:hypothetical protein